MRSPRLFPRDRGLRSAQNGLAPPLDAHSPSPWVTTPFAPPHPAPSPTLVPYRPLRPAPIPQVPCESVPPTARDRGVRGDGQLPPAVCRLGSRGRALARRRTGDVLWGDGMDFGTQGSPAPAELAWLRAVDAYTIAAYPQAEEEFRAAVRLDPTMADAWLGLHALRADTSIALLRMHRHRDRFGEMRARHRRTLNSWYWLGWWVQPVLETGRDLLLAHASHWLDGRHVAELDQALAACPRSTPTPKFAFCTPAAPISSRTGTSSYGRPSRCSPIRCWASRRGCSAGWRECGWRCTGRPSRCCPPR